MQNVCGEHIIIPAGIENVDFSKIISLNPTAAYLWENVAKMESFTVEDMAKPTLEKVLCICNLINPQRIPAKQVLCT